MGVGAFECFSCLAIAFGESERRGAALEGREMSVESGRNGGGGKERECVCV